MSEAAGWVLVFVVAVLVAVAVPALLQLRKTLKELEVTLETTGRHVNTALNQLSTTLERVNRATGELERGVGRVSSLLEVLGGLGDALTKVRQTVGTVASLGSILGGAFMAAMGLRHRDRETQPEPPVRAEPQRQQEAEEQMR